MMSPASNGGTMICHQVMDSVKNLSSLIMVLCFWLKKQIQ